MTSRYIASSSLIAAIVAAPGGVVRGGHGVVPDTGRGPAGRDVCDETRALRPAANEGCREPWSVAAGTRERTLERHRSGRPVDTLPVAHKHVLRLKPGERLPRRTQAQERVDAERFVARPEVADRPERVADGEHAALGPPERNLAPEA